MFDFPLPPLITGGYPFTFEGDAVHWDVPSSSDSSDLHIYIYNIYIYIYMGLSENSVPRKTQWFC